MKRKLIIAAINIVVILLILLQYVKFIYPPIPLIKSVGLVDNKIIIDFKVNKYNINNDIYCLILKNEETPKIDDNRWFLSKNNKCEFVIDDNVYTSYLKNQNNKIVKIEKTSTLGKVTNFSTNNNILYLPLSSTYLPTLNIEAIGYVDKKIKWYSENENIASVDDNGIIKTISEGKTKIIGKLYDKTIKIDVISTKLIINKPKNYNNNKKYLTCNMYSKEENDLLDEILKNRVNSAGYKTRADVVEAARFITLEFPYKIRYFSENGRLTYASKIDGEGRYYHQGLYLHSSRFKSLVRSNQGPQTWGCMLYSRPSHGMRRNGLDCSGFVSWILLNGGFDVGDLGAGVVSGVKDLTDIGKKTRFTYSLIKSNKVKVGDLLSSSGPSGGHIAIIAGEDEDNYYVAESLWHSPYIGVVIVKYPKKTIYKRYYWVMLMDEYYKEDGNLTKMWY